MRGDHPADGGAGSPSAQERTHDSPGSWPGGSKDSTRPSAVTSQSPRKADPSFQEGEEIRFLTPHPYPPGVQGAQGVGDFPGAGVPEPPEEALPSPVHSRGPATGRVWRSGLLRAPQVKPAVFAQRVSPGGDQWGGGDQLGVSKGTRGAPQSGNTTSLLKSIPTPIEHECWDPGALVVGDARASSVRTSTDPAVQKATPCRVVCPRFPPQPGRPHTLHPVTPGLYEGQTADAGVQEAPSGWRAGGLQGLRPEAL